MQIVKEAAHSSLVAAGLTVLLSGAFNVVGDGVLSLSALIRSSGGAAIPLPGVLARAAIRLLEALGVAAVPSALLDYIHYSWVADGSRTEEVLGFVPRYHCREAAAALREVG